MKGHIMKVHAQAGNSMPKSLPSDVIYLTYRPKTHFNWFFKTGVSGPKLVFPWSRTVSNLIVYAGCTKSIFEISQGPTDPGLGCPRESFLAIKSGSSQELGQFFMTDRNAYYWQYIKILELSEVILTIKFLHGRVLWNF